ncbi:hypothetical protein E1263_21325 [Kribbella antibiotica]|uniref:Uncharacterized protein n=1 Tax=Kribbella antibiotica TaxID=190195 RepID=A0A4V2YPH5_9ACTN|nr:hypothetical protein [Kribbella antibiotica]TDD57917.1 hypothetical protein E1263_21325 [Kribbella antibiotica]
MASAASRALAAWLGLGALLVAGLAADLPVFPALAIGWLVIYFIVGALAIADAIRLARRADLDVAQGSANVVKIAAIPFFVLNFVALTRIVVSVGADDSDHFGFRGFLIALLFVVLTYLVLLPTSAYAVACLVVMRRDERIGRVFYGLHLILQFLFVVDVAGAVVVIEVARNRLGTARPPSWLSRNLLTGVLAVASILGAIWVIAYSTSIFGRSTADLIWYLASVPALAFFVLVAVPIVPLVAFRTAVRAFLAGDLELLRRSTRVVKLVMIPLFVQNFLVGAVIIGFLSYLPLRMAREPRDFWLIGAVASLGLIPTLIAAFLMLIPTSIYGVTCLALMLRQRLISPRYCTMHVLLHFVFVADIISTLVVARRARSNG